MLGAELICALFLVGGPGAATSGPAVAAPAAVSPSRPAAVSPSGTRTVALPDGRTAQLTALGSNAGTLLERISAELPGAAAAVSAFWGPQWRRDIAIVVAGSSEQFATLAGGGADVAATTTADRIMFSSEAAEMSPDNLRIVLRHELFHYAARADTAAGAPVWLTEGVADYVGRPAAATPPEAPATLPTDAELATPGPGRSAAYDRAWEFATFIADTYGARKLRELYVAACGHERSDVATAVRNVLGADLDTMLS